MRRIYFEIKQKIIFAIRAFYSFINGGEECVVCGGKAFVLPICFHCQQKYFTPNLSQTRCDCCGKILISTVGLCMQCREHKVLVHTQKMFPLFSYLMWNKEILFLWKIMGIRALSAFFAEKVAEVLKQLNINVIVPVPPRPGKIQKNGWDQVDELCQFLELRFGFKVLRVLERLTTEQQKKMDRKSRLEKINSAYVMKNGKQLKKALTCVNGVLPMEVCILDDVCTTGATIEKCAELLVQGGVQKITAITLFTV